jgi:hypothetical protein
MSITCDIYHAVFVSNLSCNATCLAEYMMDLLPRFVLYYWRNFYLRPVNRTPFTYTKISNLNIMLLFSTAGSHYTDLL